MSKIKEVSKMDFLINEGWYFEIDEVKAPFISDINPIDIGKYISMDDLNTFTREVLSRIYNDPSSEAYRTPERLAKLNIESIIKDNDIGSSLHNFNGDKILYLNCDSDRYTLALQWFINLDKNEGFIG